MSNISMTPVLSSNVKSVGYDSSTKVLAVEFIKNGGVYHYMDVPQKEYDDLLSSPSVGKDVRVNIVWVYKGVKQ